MITYVQLIGDKVNHGLRIAEASQYADWNLFGLQLEFEVLTTSIWTPPKSFIHT